MGQNKKNVHTQLLMTYVVRKKIVKCIAYKNTGNLIYIKYMKHIYVKKTSLPGTGFIPTKQI